MPSPLNDEDDVLGNVGHNSVTGAAQKQLLSIVERIERLEEDKRAVASDIKEVYSEAKGNGFDVPTLRRIVALRRKDAEERQEQESLLDLYMSALGML